MESQNEHTRPGQSQPAEPAPPKKRFRLEKLKERIAPASHLNPHSNLVGDGSSRGGTSSGRILRGY